MFTKRQKVTYTSNHGNKFSAVVTTVHRDGSYAIMVCFSVGAGRELGTYWGLSADNVSSAQLSAELPLPHRFVA
jgi:hypothetical protein